MNDFLAKPFDVDAAVALIARLAPNRGPALAPDSVDSGARQDARGQSDAPGRLDARDWPGIAVDRGLQAWADMAIYQKYLRKFIRDFTPAVAQMMQSDPIQVAALAHKLRGAAGSLAMDDVAQCAGEVERLAKSGHSADAAIAKLGDAMAIAASTISKHAGVDSATSVAPAEPRPAEDLPDLDALLVRAAQALGNDNPDAIEPLIVELRGWFAEAQLAPLVEAIEAFDFRAAETIVRQLASSTANPGKA
jgi:HPt (histidine-containing phosphotransfer) domain-containing protein